MITNLPPEAQESFEESARQMARLTGCSYEEALERLVRVFEAFTKNEGGKVQITMMPRDEEPCRFVAVPMEPRRRA